MNRFGFCKQEGPVFRIRDLNSPWRSVLHLGQRQMVGKSYQWEDDPETSTFSFLEKGRVRLLNLSETGKERIVLYIEPGCLFREIVLLHVSPSHPASLVALEPCEVYNSPGPCWTMPNSCGAIPALMMQSGPLARSQGRGLLQPDNRKRRAGPADAGMPVSAPAGR